jgi:hypothetical protein
LNEQGIVASICPKVTEPAAGAEPATDASYGYNPAVAAIIERLRSKLQGNCLPRPIQTKPDTHQVLCSMIEAQPSGCGSCNGEGRGPANPDFAADVQRELARSGYCDGPKQPKCSSFCQCEIKQESGANLEACRQNQAVPAGFCYVDDPASPLLAGCPDNQKHLLRFVGSTDGRPTPAPGAVAFIACLGEAISQSSVP